MKPLKPFFLKTLILSVVVGVLTAGLKYSGLIPQIHHQWYWILLFFFVFTLFIFQLLLKALGKEPRKFFTTFLSISFFRMLLFIAIMLTYAFFLSPDVASSISFIITLAAYYLIFTTWELVLIVPVIKKKPNK